MRRLRPAPRGMTLVEMLVALAVLAISLLGVAQLQIVAANQNHMAQRTAYASALANDLIQNVELWNYQTDARLIPAGCSGFGSAFTCTSADGISSVGAAIVSQRSVLVNSSNGLANNSNAPTFAEGSGTPVSAVTNNALYNGSTLQYDGYTQTSIAGPVTFQRYWSVFSLQPGDIGRLVVVTVLWEEPGVIGYREVIDQTFLVNMQHLGANALGNGAPE